MSTPQEKNDIAQLFTNTERETLRIWFDLDQAGLDVDADAMLQAGLQLEHFQSRLDDVVANRSQADLAKEAELAANFANVSQLMQAKLDAMKKAGGGAATLTPAQFQQLANFFAWR